MICPATPTGETLVGQRHHFDLAVQPLGQLGVVVEAADGVVDIPLCFGKRLAVVPHFQAGQVLAAATQVVGDGAQVAGALLAGAPAPFAFIEGPTRRLHGTIHILTGSGGNLGQHRFAGRFVHLEAAALCGCLPLAIDIELVAHAKVS